VGEGAIETHDPVSDGANRTLAKARAGLNLNLLIKTTIGLKPLETFINHLEEQTTPTSSTPDPQRGRSEGAEKTVGVGEWSFEKILQGGGLSVEKTWSVLAEIRADPDAGLRLLAWVLYGYSQRSGSGRAGIDSPVIYAATRYSGAAPAPEYLALANKTPAELLELLESPFTRRSTPVERRLLEELEDSGLPELIRQTCRKR
jgi:hypothetical protein